MNTKLRHVTGIGNCPGECRNLFMIFFYSVALKETVVQFADDGTQLNCFQYFTSWGKGQRVSGVINNGTDHSYIYLTSYHINFLDILNNTKHNKLYQVQAFGKNPRQRAEFPISVFVLIICNTRLTPHSLVLASAHLKCLLMLSWFLLPSQTTPRALLIHAEQRAPRHIAAHSQRCAD